MSSKGSVCLLVLMGLVMAFGSPTVYVTDNLRQKHNSIAEALGLNDKSYGEIAVFQTIIKNSTCQGKYGIQLMNATLDVYRQIFSTILHDNTMPLLNEVANEEKKQTLIKNLKELQHEMATVQRQLDAPRRNKEQLIRRLNEIQVNDPSVQKKALSHFLEIYNAAKNSYKCCFC